MHWIMDSSDLYNLLFDKITVVTRDDGHSQLPRFAKLLRWSSSLGCVIQACDEQITSPIRSQGATRPSLFISATLSARWKGGEPYSNMTDVSHGENTLVAIGLRETVSWIGEMPCCDRLRVVGIGIPASALEALGLGERFDDMFEDRGAPIAIKAVPMSPQIKRLAEEMLDPPVEGGLGHLLAEAHATEMIARSLLAFADEKEVAMLNDRDRMAVRRVRDLFESDLSHDWTLAELAKHAGFSARSLNTKFRTAFDASVFEYLKRRRLEFAHETLMQRRMSVSEIAYQVGYESPANFATAFRRHFGYVPTALLRPRVN
jgi:AraC-like DNA-binding protein